jgi:hypothetical protein
VSEAARRPRGFGAFDALAKKLIKVPKEEVDAAVAKTPKRKSRKKK